MDQFSRRCNNRCPLALFFWLWNIFLLCAQNRNILKILIPRSNRTVVFIINFFWKQVNLHRAMSNAELLSYKVVPSKKKEFEEDGIAFTNSTEHLMPINSKRYRNKKRFCPTPKDNFWTGCAYANSHHKKMILHIPTQLKIWCTNPKKNNSEQHFTFPSQCWNEKLFRKRRSSKIPIMKDNSLLKTKFSIWCKCLGEQKNRIWDEKILVASSRKRQVSKIVFSSFLRETSFFKMLRFRKLTTESGVEFAW